MAINNPYTYQAPTQPYVNINAYNPTSVNTPGVYTKFVGSEQEAYSNISIPPTGCAFGIDGDNMVLYARFADGHMEIYDMVQRMPPKQPEPLTADAFSELLDKKLSDFENNLSKKFVLRKDNNQNRGGNLNG